MTNWYVTVSETEQKKEKVKARELRRSQWWRQQVGPGICYHCHQKFLPKDLTMDHLIPISRGGKSNKKNCVPSCKSCNSLKGSRTKADMALDNLKK